jgi:hypothetical protein
MLGLEVNVTNTWLIFSLSQFEQFLVVAGKQKVPDSHILCGCIQAGYVAVMRVIIEVP